MLQRAWDHLDLHTGKIGDGGMAYRREQSGGEEVDEWTSTPFLKASN
jgi:hypothetical protein